MERESIKLTSEQAQSIVSENYYLDGETTIPVIIKSTEHVDTYRHTEEYELVFEKDSKFYLFRYEDSVKDEMGWYECNTGDITATQVFPEQVIVTRYK